MKKNVIIFTTLLCTLVSAQSNLNKGNEWYNRRAEGATGFRAATAPIDSAISYFERSLDGGDENEAALMLVKAFYFKGEYTTNDKEEKKLLTIKPIEEKKKLPTIKPIKEIGPPPIKPIRILSLDKTESLHNKFNFPNDIFSF